MFVKTGLLITIVGASMLAPTVANAAIFKCVGVEGEVSYNQTPCPVEQETAKILSTASASGAKFDCRIANNFARKTAMQMQTGQSSGDMFASYGGIDAIPSTAIGVINYVYTHKGNQETSSQRIAALSAARCSGGSYGPVGCDDFPYGFVAELGGCEMATQSTLTDQKTVAASAPTNTNATTQNASTQTMAARTAADKNTSSTKCTDSVQDQLGDLFAQMSSDNSDSANGKLEEKKQSLQSQLSDCS